MAVPESAVSGQTFWEGPLDALRPGPQRAIQPDRNIDAPIAATTAPPQKSASLAPALAAIRAVIAPITNSGSPTSQRQETLERPGGGRNVRLIPQRSRATG